MAYTLRCDRVWWKPTTWYKPWYYDWILSSYGMFMGRAWTRKRAELALRLGQSEMLAQ